MELNVGKMILIDADGKEYKFENIPQMETTLEPDIPEDPNYTFVKQFISLPSATFSIRMTKEQYFKLIDTATGLFKMICELCPNKKVVHLAKSAKKRKTRKKNRTRIIRILEQMR